jgi:hypothetical protein
MFGLIRVVLINQAVLSFRRLSVPCMHGTRRRRYAMHISKIMNRARLVPSPDVGGSRVVGRYVSAPGLDNQ